MKQENILEKIERLKNYDGDDKVILSDEMIKILNSQSKPVQIKSNILSLDNYLEGFQGGELITISGNRKNGKTLLAKTLTKKFSEQNINCLWFSFEVTIRQFIDQFNFNGKVPLFMLPQKLKSCSMNWLQERIYEAYFKYRIQCVFIDHLHYLFDIARSKNVSLEIGQVIRQLKSLAIELDIVIFILCHFQKTVKEEDITDDLIRDSSFITQESDVALLIWRIKEDDNKALVKISYSRRTGVMEKIIPFVKNGNCLEEV